MAISQPEQSLSLKSGQSYTFNSTTLTRGNIADKFCPGAEDQNCPDWLKEKVVQFRYTSPDIQGITFDYLAEESRKSVETPRLKITLISVDFGHDSAKVILEKKNNHKRNDKKKERYH